jgi:hypothetical protein
MKNKLRKCEICDDKISKLRLKAMPSTTMCVKCAEKYGGPPRRAYLEPDPDANYPRGW